MSTSGANLEPGDRVGEYELLAPVGAGGMGRVWVAREVSSRRLVAIKTALTEQGATEQFWKVLLDEARIASRVQHPNVCAIHSADQQRGMVYLVMDWSDGGSLREVLDACPAHRMDINLAARVVARVCAGLHAVHELTDDDGSPLHVVHRDVSPQNILVATSGQVRLTDFGIAKARGQMHAPTQTGEVKGKLSYMAPEQVTTKHIDRRADIFALGCVLYEATTGERPFRGEDALATMYQLLEQPLVLPSARLTGYPPELEAILVKTLQRDPAQRYATAEELCRALEGFLISRKAVVSESEVGAFTRKALAERIALRTRELEAATARIERRNKEPRSSPVPRSSPPRSERASTSSPPVAKAAESKRRGVMWGSVGGASLLALAAVLVVILRQPENTSAAASVGASPNAGKIDLPSSMLETEAAPVAPAVSSAALVAPSVPAPAAEPTEEAVGATAQKPATGSRPNTKGRPKPVADTTPAPAVTTVVVPQPPELLPTGRKPIRTLDPSNPFAPKEP